MFSFKVRLKTKSWYLESFETTWNYGYAYEGFCQRPTDFPLLFILESLFTVYAFVWFHFCLLFFYSNSIVSSFFVFILLFDKKYFVTNCHVKFKP